MKAKIDNAKRVTTVMLGDESCAIPAVDQETYLDFLDVREEVMGEQQARAGYTRAQYMKIRDMVLRIYGGAVDAEVITKRATPGQIIAAFVAVEVAVAGETGDAVGAVRSNFRTGA